MRSLRLALVLALAGSAVAVGAPADAAEPPGTASISSVANSKVKAVALSPGRVTWVASNVKDGPLSKRSVAVDGSTLTLGPEVRIGATQPKSHGACCGDTSFPEGYPFSASGARTGWTTETNATYYSNGSTVSTVTNGGRMSTGTTVSKAFAAPSEVLRVSGTRVLFRNKSGFQLYDLPTRATTNLSTTFGGAAKNLVAVELFGRSLYFARTDGSIWRKVLGTSFGSTQVVGPGPAVDVKIFAWGDWLAWHRQVNSTGDCGLRQLGQPAVALTECPAALTDAGAILRDKDTGASSLHQYGGVTVDLPVPSTATQVAIDGGVLAWIESDGTGKLAPLPNAPNTVPQDLGNPITSTRYKRGGPSWTLNLVASTALAKCSVVLVNAHGKTFRTLPCSSGLLPAGEVQARWDGKNAAGVTVPAGTYYWGVDAADAELDQLLSIYGTTAGPSGAITVS